jgi:hypothetical protein
VWIQSKKDSNSGDKVLTEQEELLLMKYFDQECSIFEGRAAERLLRNNSYAREFFDGFKQLSSDVNLWSKSIDLQAQNDSVLDSLAVDLVEKSLALISQSDQLNSNQARGKSLEGASVDKVVWSYPSERPTGEVPMHAGVVVSTNKSDHKTIPSPFNNIFSSLKIGVAFNRLGWALSGAMASVAALLFCLTEVDTEKHQVKLNFGNLPYLSAKAVSADQTRFTFPDVSLPPVTRLSTSNSLHRMDMSRREVNPSSTTDFKVNNRIVDSNQPKKLLDQKTEGVEVTRDTNSNTTYIWIKK